MGLLILPALLGLVVGALVGAVVYQQRLHRFAKAAGLAALTAVSAILGILQTRASTDFSFAILLAQLGAFALPFVVIVGYAADQSEEQERLDQQPWLRNAIEQAKEQSRQQRLQSDADD